MRISEKRVYELMKEFEKRGIEVNESVWIEWLSSNRLVELLGRLYCMGKLMGLKCEEIEDMLWEEIDYVEEWDVKSMRDLDELIKEIKNWKIVLRWIKEEEGRSE